MEGRAFLQSLLNKRLRISIKDGRVIDGHFMCTDNSCNIVLSNCEEFLTQEDIGKSQNRDKSETVNIRTLGLAIVPGDQIFSISVQDTQLSNELLEHINISSSNNTTACSSESSISS